MIKSIKSLSKEAILKAIKSGDKSILHQLYESYRMDFLHFGKRYLQDETKLLDTYQDAFVVFFEQVQSDKLSTLESSIKTYIFSIGKYMLIKKFKDSLKEQPTETIDTLVLTQDDIQEQIELTDRQERIAAAIQELGEGCKNLLVLFYYKKYSIEAIKDDLAYKTVSVVKTKKRRCLDYLKRIIVEKYSDLY